MLHYSIMSNPKLKLRHSWLEKHVSELLLYLCGSRNSDSDYSDGEEDFYYSEIEVNMDSLTEGLSNLTPTSPTTAGPPPVFPPPLAEVPHSEHINVNGLQSHAPTLLSQSAPSTLCHIRTDHAYQVIHACRKAHLWHKHPNAQNITGWIVTTVPRKQDSTRLHPICVHFQLSLFSFFFFHLNICRGSLCYQCDKTFWGQFKLLNSYIGVGVNVSERKGKQNFLENINRGQKRRSANVFLGGKLSVISFNYAKTPSNTCLFPSLTFVLLYLFSISNCTVPWAFFTSLSGAAELITKQKHLVLCSIIENENGNMLKLFNVPLLYSFPGPGLHGSI